MDDISKFIGDENLNVAEAMRRIDENTCGVLFIVNSNRVLLGCVSDGDIRRFLLSGGSLNDPVLAATNKKPKIAHSIDEAKGLYHKKYVVAVPILDKQIL